LVAGRLAEFAALLVEPNPETALLVKDVGHVQAAGRRNLLTLNMLSMCGFGLGARATK
jgi:hypothetical protein